MATKKDLVEAHAFSRRRLVTAFLSGAPGGREVEPSRPGRTIIGGIALSVLLIAGAAIASVLAARTPADWNKQGLILSQENNALYVILKQQDPPELLPVINVTSAQLIFGADSRATTVSRDTINEQTPGQTIGIFNAPPELPTTDHLIETRWTACTGNGLGIKVNIARTLDVASGKGAGFLVKADDSYYLITTGADDGGVPRARYYPVPAGGVQDSMLRTIGVGVEADAMEVPSDWLTLFEPGGPLGWDSFHVQNPGGPLPADLDTGDLARLKAHIGDYVVAPDDSSGTVLTGDGPVPLSDPFAVAVYEASLLPGTAKLPTRLPDDTTIPDVSFGGETYTDANWPTGRVRTPPGQACAVLNAAKDQRPAVELGIDPGEDASAGDVALGTKPVRVDPGNGAFVYGGSFDEAASDAPAIINSQGNLYPLADTLSIQKLGYSSVKAPVIPDTWTKLFTAGVSLSTTAALCPPNDGDAGPAPDQECRSLDEDSGATTGTTGSTG